LLAVQAPAAATAASPPPGEQPAGGAKAPLAADGPFSAETVIELARTLAGQAYAPPPTVKNSGR
jgi:hypothetical protein